MQDKNGFTLVELLAVIVILAVVMTIAVTAITPLMAKSQKGALGSEGLSLVEAAQIAYQAQQMASDNKLKPTESACFDLAWLRDQGYFSAKKDLKDYSGSVLVKYIKNSESTIGGSYEYTFWISDKTYTFSAVEVDSYALDLATEGNPGADFSKCGTYSSDTTVKKIPS